MFDGMHDGWMWGMHWAWWTFWVLVIVASVWLLTRAQQSGSPSPRETPLDALKRRYAEGEISTEDYEERKDRLERDR